MPPDLRALYALSFETIIARVAELRRLCANLCERLDRSRAVQTWLADAMVERALAIQCLIE